MNSKLLHKKSENAKPILLAFYLEPPKKILEEIYPKYQIYQYGDIILPLDRLTETDHSQKNHGMIIKKGTVPPGLKVVASFYDSKLKIPPYMPMRDREQMRLSLKEAAEIAMIVNLDGFGTTANYLEDYNIVRQYREFVPVYERKKEQLFDIAEVVFGMKRRNVKSRQELLR